MILLYISQKDILLCQRTSHSFRKTVAGSVRLQRALFLAPDWTLQGRHPNLLSRTNRTGCKPENNRLLLRAFPGCYPTVTLVIVNDRGREHWSWDVCISFPADQPPDTSPAVLYPEASWRRMYLSQPPCSSLHLMRRWQRSQRPAVVRRGGIMMGEFVDEATKSMVADDPPPTSSLASLSLAPMSLVGGVVVAPSPRWHRSYISSDRDWHFAGNINCSSLDAENNGELEA